MKQVRLNRAEVWIADHALPIFGAVALAIIAGAVAIFVVFLNQRDTAHQVNVLKPQVTRVNKAICDRQSLTHPDRATRCAERIRVGLINCRHSEPCRAAFLAVATSPPPARPISTLTGGGGAIQQPSNHGHQHPSPGSQPGQGHGHGHGGGHESAPQAPESPPGAESGGQGGGQAPGQERPPAGQGGGQGGSSSGAGVEVCVEAVNTCVEAEVGLGR
ncbi:MAG TPA: hypothetical protein VF245_12785 [Solirubrobacterales bacterium]